MAPVDLRVRLMGRLTRRSSITRMDEQAITRAQQQTFAHNRLTDLIYGAVAPGVTLTDATVAGQVGPMPVRLYRPDAPADGPRPVVISIHGGGWLLER